MARPSPPPPRGSRKLPGTGSPTCAVAPSWTSPLPITLTTPDGLTRLGHDDGSHALDRDRPCALCPTLPSAEPPPPPTPTRADLTLDVFDEGYSLVIGPSDDDEDDRGGGGGGGTVFLASPFADPDEEDEEDVFASYWSFSSSDSDSDDDEEEHMGAAEIMDLGQYDGDPVRILCTDPNGLTSFPSLEPYPSDHGGGGVVAGAEGVDKAAVAGASASSATMELIEAVEAVESEYHDGGGWWRSSSSSSSSSLGARPLPSWAWLRSSNSFPMYRLGPNDLRHGPSKLRLACSASDDDDDNDDDSGGIVAMMGAVYS